MEQSKISQNMTNEPKASNLRAFHRFKSYLELRHIRATIGSLTPGSFSTKPDDGHSRVLVIDVVL